MRKLYSGGRKEEGGGAGSEDARHTLVGEAGVSGLDDMSRLMRKRELLLNLAVGLRLIGTGPPP